MNSSAEGSSATTVAALAVGEPRRTAAALRVKRSLDVTVAISALILLSVLLLMIAAAILIMEGRPIMIRHRRIGKDGVDFDCLKFRTMVNDADAVLVRHLASDAGAMLEWQASRKLKNDPRVTPIGRVLRETSIDELPQLINILRGDMSLVGPRPIVIAEVPKYGSAIAEYKAVRPGLTGLWQCSGRNDVGYDRRVLLDSHYVRTWSISRDLAIIAKTIPAVLRARGVY
ncbi:MAG: sugar transferase [Methylobacterium sp.]|nr:sugar transferase [Methylobacterium sp.]